MMDEEFFQRATDLSRLSIRRGANERLGQADLNQWILGVAKVEGGEKVLDVGCGDGKQLLAYAKLLGSVGEAVGLDISAQALQAVEINAAKAHVSVRLALGAMENILSLLTERNHFDLISCCYSLYYSRFPAKTLQDFKNLLKTSGRLLIVGPDQDNNSEFYRFLHGFGPLPAEIQMTLRFMIELVIPECQKLFAHVDHSLFENPVVFPTAEDVLNYWRATDAFNREIEKELARAVEHYFKSNSSFTIVKRAIGVLAY